MTTRFLYTLVGIRFIFLETFVCAVEHDEETQSVDQNLLLGIFIGIWICMACYILTGWIVDIVRKRHIFYKAPESAIHVDSITDVFPVNVARNTNPLYNEINGTHIRNMDKFGNIGTVNSETHTDNVITVHL